MGLCNEDLVSKVFVLETSHSLLVFSHVFGHMSVKPRLMGIFFFFRADKRIKGQASSILTASTI